MLDKMRDTRGGTVVSYGSLIAEDPSQDPLSFFASLLCLPWFLGDRAFVLLTYERKEGKKGRKEEEERKDLRDAFR